MMQDELTRVTPPLIPAGLVARPALLDALDRGDDRALTVLCAPPGYGKSLLLAHWVAKRAGAPTAWVNLEPDDEDPCRLWAAVLTALRACPGVPADNRLHRLVVPRTSIPTEFFADLVEALDALPTRIVLVLDDAHHLGAAEALHGLRLMVYSSRRRLRLLLATQSDPGPPLARMRREEQVCELRAPQLRFSAEESAVLLERQGIRLADGYGAVLDDRIDGWPAGLRLVAMRLRGHPDPGAFIASFCGNERPVAEYLVGEVLECISEGEREVLRSTSICDPLPVRLAVELSGREDAARIFDRLEHDTGLVVGMDPQRAAYRVHRLLRSHLVADLMRSGPNRVATLHRRAALWSSAEGRARAALHHAAEAADRHLIADLLHRWAPELIARGEHRALLRAFAAAGRQADRSSEPRPRLSHTVRLGPGEREVLNQLPSRRNLDEIADHLAVPADIVKSHVRAIYATLRVSSRRTAVLAAHEQGLLR